MPPCQPWVEAEEIAACCDVTPGSLNQAALDQAADVASGILYEISGRRYPGTCETTVRPEGRTVCFGWGPRVTRALRPREKLSRVKLAGHATAIVEVEIDGQTIDPDGYRLDENIYLTRMADADGNPQHWPRTQRLDLPLGDTGTFGVTYQHGLQPPPAGVQAAVALACELYRACPAAGDEPGECNLPEGARRIVRQGVTVEIVRSLAAMLRQGATGIAAIDSFVAGYGRRTRRSAVWSPDIQPFARPEGITSGS